MSLLQKYTKDGVKREAQSAAASVSLATRYVLASTNRNRCGFCVGVFTVALVVGFVALLQATISQAPFIFLKLAQDSVGQNDVVFVAESSNRSTTPLLNFTDVQQGLALNPLVAGTAPRWILLAQLMNRDDATLNSTVIVLATDTELEGAAGIGTEWNRRPLGEDESYVSNTALSEIGVPANEGAKATLRLDLQQLLSSLLYGADADLGSSGFTAESVRNVLDGVGVSLDPISISTSDTLKALLDALGINSDNVPDDLGVTTIEAELLLAAALNATLAGDAEDASSVAIERDITVIGGIGKPKGKFPSSLGNVVMLEAKHLPNAVKRVLLDALDTIGTVASALGLGQEWNDAVQPLRDTLDDLSYELLKQYSMQTVVMHRDRIDVYRQEIKPIQRDMADFSASLIESLGVSYPVSVSAPIASTLEGTQFIALFLDQIFAGTVFLLLLLGAMVIYALVLGDVEAKTYEYGMLRVLGLRHGTLALLLIVQTLLFSGPGIVIGLVFAAVANIGVSAAVGAFAGFDASASLPSSAVTIAILIGSLMPTLANIIPIRRALSSTLRDAIDMYHQSFADVKVIMLKLSKMGMSLWQLAISVLMVLVGFTTFFLIPLSFVLRDFSLFLTILNTILLGMVVGLSLMTSALQSTAERFILWLMLWRQDMKLWTVITKNLAGHKNRNSKSAYMISIAVAFLVFAGAMFALQARSLKDNVKVFVGSDLMVLDITSSSDGLPQEELLPYLTDAQSDTEDGVATIGGYTFVTHPLDDYANVGAVESSNLAEQPMPSSRTFGVQANYLDVCFKQYAEITESQSESDARNIVRRLHEGAGSIVLPVERGRSAPPSTVTGSTARYEYVCNATSAEDARQAIADFSLSSYWLLSLCEQLCGQGGQCVGADNAPTDDDLDVDVADSYRQYIDVIGSEGFRALTSGGVKVPLRIAVEAESSTQYRQRTYLGKARGYVYKMPGFFFSSYSTTGWNSPMLMRMQSFAEIVGNVQRDVELISDGQGQERPADEDENSQPTGPGTGSPVGDGGDDDDVQGQEASVGVPEWAQSRTRWLYANNTSPTVPAHPAHDCLDNDAATYTEFQSPGQASLFLDLTQCLAVNGIRISGVGNEAQNVAAVSIEAAATPQGPFKTVTEFPVERFSAPGVYRSFKFLVYSSRYWRISMNATDSASSAVAVSDVQLSVGASSLCDATLLLEDDLSIGVAKRKLHVRLLNANDKAAKDQVVNSIRNFLDTDFATVVDVSSVLKDTDDVAAGLQGFFTFVSALCLVLIFFATWLSFDANLRENSREFGILRSLGLSKSQVTRVYLYEAMSVVLSSFSLGTAIGLLVACTLTLQFNLFTEMPFNFEFPSLLFFFTFSVSVVVALVSSLFPARAFARMSIANVVKGKRA